MPNPRKAKNVSATLETMSRSGGYPEGASNAGLMFSSVATANSPRLPSTTKTITVCARATTCDPTMLTTVIAMMIRAANIFVHVALPPANAALA